MNTKLYFVRAFSPIHCGTGQAVGGVDLPIARERPTDMPLIPGSSVKGVLRSLGREGDPLHRAAFGPDTERASEHAGSVQFSDANLLFLPIRSVRGTFGYVTSTYLLRRFARDAKEAGVELPPLPAGPRDTGDAIVASDVLTWNQKVVLDDFDLAAKKDERWASWCNTVAPLVFGEPADRERFVERACIVHEDVMSVLVHTGLELVARNRLDVNTHTVAKGALWTEEALPVESVLAGLFVATPVGKGDAKKTPDELFGYVSKLVRGAIQIGGKATVGRGICEMKVG